MNYDQIADVVTEFGYTRDSKGQFTRNGILLGLSLDDTSAVKAANLSFYYPPTRTRINLLVDSLDIPEGIRKAMHAADQVIVVTETHREDFRPYTGC